MSNLFASLTQDNMVLLTLAVIGGVSGVMSPLVTILVQSRVQRNNRTDHGESMRRLATLSGRVDRLAEVIVRLVGRVEGVAEDTGASRESVAVVRDHVEKLSERVGVLEGASQWR